MVRSLRGGRVRVYDIQVEEDRNFFADGILVHNCLLIDDPVKNWEEAQSVTVSEGAWEWFQSTARTRLQPNAAIVVCMTRWHPDDLVGRLLKADADGGEHWEHLRLPALAEDGDPLGRDVGEALWPAWYSAEALAQTRLAIGEQYFAGLYQQDPTLDAARLLRLEYFRSEPVPAANPGQLVYQFWDTAFTEKTSSDWSVCGTWRLEQNCFRLLDVWRGRVTYPDLKTQARRLYQQWQPTAMVIEAKGSGLALAQEFSRDTTWPVVVFSPDRWGDKVARVHAVTPLMAAGRCVLPDAAPWKAEYLAELLGFPRAAHDDQVDMTTMALITMGATASQQGWIGEFEVLAS